MVITLKVSLDSIVKRITGRLVCSKCGNTFNKFFDPPPSNSACCEGGTLEKRSDDNVETAQIDTLLMSCRIIGRNIEYAFMNYILEKSRENNITYLKAKHMETRKNEQVKEFYDSCSFDLVGEDDSVRQYILNTNNYKPKQLNYIEVRNGK